MYIPVIPEGYNKIVVNKNIILSDTKLDFKKKKQKKIKITTINDVQEFELEFCVKMILDSNSKIMFNTIQYSKRDKKVYFYANDYVSTNAWVKRNEKKYKPFIITKEILKEIKEIIENDKCNCMTCISVYDFINISRNQYVKNHNLLVTDITPIKSINSSFEIELDSYSVCIYLKEYRGFLSLYFKTDGNNNYYICKSDYLKELLEVSDKEILSKIFVRISECPEILHDVLYEFRLKQLKREEKEKKVFNIKKKILSLFNKKN